MTSMTALPAALANALSQRGYTALTPVQSAMAERAQSGRDLLVSAQTGSGKTVAFGIAIASQLADGENGQAGSGIPRALVIAPTRELALQVRRELEWLFADTGARFASCVGGMDMRRERRALEAGADLVVGTPGRLRDHITRGALDLSDLSVMVLDEADEMLDLGFRDDLEFILSAAPDGRRTLMFSATVPAQIADLARRFQRDAERVSVTTGERQHADIEYRMVLTAPSERENAVINTLLEADARNSIVFCSTREAVRHLASRLYNRGFSVVALSGELTQAERSNALQSMRDGRARVCVATDVAARGIDLPSLDLVIHADLPSNSETLLHRSGRTGRAGRKGVCAVIVPHHRRRSAERLLKGAKIDARVGPAASAASIRELNAGRVLEGFQAPPDPQEEERDLAARLLAAHGAEALALAFARMRLESFPTPEELSDEPAPRFDASLGERPQTRFADGIWFRATVGRKNRAEPRWLLPMICKAGAVGRHEVGSIRILDHETRFEIAAHAADGFAEQVQRQGATEKGVTITRLQGDPADLALPVKKKHRKGMPGRDSGPDSRSDSERKAPKGHFASRAKGPRKSGRP